MNALRRRLRPLRDRFVDGRKQALGSLIGVVTGVDIDRPLVALTFDDGPDPVTTPAVLAVLATYGARATFFMVGRRAAEHPDLVDRIATDGHAIGHHTLDHVSLPQLRSDERREQIVGGFEAVGPACASLFRPPFGHLDPASWWTARRAGHEIIAWSCHPFDWTVQAEAGLAAGLRDCLSPGAIILLHDAPQPQEASSDEPRAALVRALDEVLRNADQNWAFVTVPELMAAGRPRRRVRWRSPA